jgi:hypothetical protein
LTEKLIITILETVIMIEHGETYITRFSAWAPGIESSGEWDEWAMGKREISSEVKTPGITYTDSAFRRRLSQISKMSIQVIHDLLPLGENTKILFSSFRGELSREYQIFKMLREEGTVSPAAFSLSGFNTPVALASIAFGLKGGYSAIYPVNNSYTACVTAARAMLFSGATEEVVLVYADEHIPRECEFFFREYPAPVAFGLLLSRNSTQSSVPLSFFKEEDNPLAFLKQVLLSGKIST